MIRIDPATASWALQRIRADERLSAELANCHSRLTRLNPTKQERVLRAEPISTIIGLTALIQGIGVSAAVAGAIGGAVVSIGFSIGISYASAALQRNRAGSQQLGIGALNTPSVRYNERQPIPSKRIIYGTAQVGGALFFEQVKPPYLYQGLLICARKISAVRKLWIGTTEISFPTLVPDQILTPVRQLGQPNYPEKLKASFRLGDNDQPIDPLLDADFPNLDASFRQQGIATAVLRYSFGLDSDEFTALWGQVQRPNPLMLVNGVALPDPREPSHILDWNPNDPDSIEEAEASWSFSNNAALAQAHYLTQRYGGRILPSRMDWDKVAKAADWDDGLIGCLDGTFIKRHTIDGVITLNQSPSSVLPGLLSANRGFVLESAGRTWVSSSIPRKPIATIHDKLLTGAVEYRAAKPKRDMLNRVKTEFVAEDREYQTTVGPVLSRTDLQAVEQELLDATLNLPFTFDHRRTQRLARAYLDGARLGAQLSVRCDVRLLANCAENPIGNTVNFDSQLFPQCNGEWFVASWGFADGFSSIDISLSEYDPAIETSYTAADDEQPFVLADLDVS